jgi:hypothetical protein
LGDIEHPIPDVDWETHGYWEGAARHELVLEQCADCSVVQHRPRALCVSCLSSRITHFVASGRGTVYTYTVTHQNNARGFRNAVPYVLAYVELEEGPRLLTNIVDCDPDAVRIGMPVQSAFADVAGGMSILRFRPA